MRKGVDFFGDIQILRQTGIGYVKILKENEMNEKSKKDLTVSQVDR